MFVMDYYGHKLSNGVLFAHHLILDVPGGSSHLGYRRRVPLGHNPGSRVKYKLLPSATMAVTCASINTLDLRPELHCPLLRVTNTTMITCIHI